MYHVTIFINEHEELECCVTDFDFSQNRNGRNGIAIVWAEEFKSRKWAERRADFFTGMLHRDIHDILREAIETDDLFRPEESLCNFPPECKSDDQCSCIHEQIAREEVERLNNRLLLEGENDDKI